MIFRLLGASAIILVLLNVTACSSLRESSVAIRRTLLFQTPIGSSQEEVLTVLNEHQYKASQSNSGFLRQERHEPTAVIGVSSIRAELGDYWVPPFLTTSVTAFWGFDADKKLLDIWVWKTTDAP